MKINQRNVKTLRSQVDLQVTSQENHRHQRRKPTQDKQQLSARTVAAVKNLALPVSKENPKEQDPTVQKAHKDQTQTKRPKEGVTHLQSQVNINKVHQKIITKGLNKRNNGRRIIMRTLISPITMIITGVGINHVVIGEEIVVEIGNSGTGKEVGILKSGTITGSSKVGMMIDEEETIVSIMMIVKVEVITIVITTMMIDKAEATIIATVITTTTTVREVLTTIKEANLSTTTETTTTTKTEISEATIATTISTTTKTTTQETTQTTRRKDCCSQVARPAFKTMKIWIIECDFVIYMTVCIY